MYRILLVDDEPIVKVALRTIADWESIGFTICATASDGNEALEQVERFRPDIIITDLKMPRMDGLELIKRLNEQKYTGKILVASNFGEYELVREALTLGAMDYVLKISIKSDALVELIKKAASTLEEERQAQEMQKQQIRQMQRNIKMVHNIMLKEYLTDPNCTEELLIKNSPKESLRLSPACLCYVSLQPLKSISLGEKRAYHTDIIESILFEIFDKFEGIEIIPIELSSLLLIVPTEQLEKKGIQLIELINKIADTLKLYTSTLPTVVYSFEFTGYIQQKMQFQKCKEAMNIQFYYSQNIICAEEIKFQHFLTGQKYQDFAAELGEQLKFGDTASAAALVSSLFEQCYTHLVHPEIVKSFLRKTLDYITLCTPELNITDNVKFDAYKEDIPACNSFAKLKSISYEALILLQSGSEYVIPSMKKEVQSVITFINKNYANKISLSYVASQVNMNENYLCRIFKEQTGKSIMNYLNDIRMENAAKIILGGNVYMKEVAAAVGIEDPFYFTRLFKKHFSINPTEYKVANRKKKDSYES